MKKIIILLFAVVVTNSIFCQEKAIKITNQVSKKEIIIKENKRIKIKTIDGQKFAGRFKIENNSILIKNEYIELDDIEQIKRNPLLISILTKGFFIYGGALTAGFGAIIGLTVNSNAFLLAIPAAGMIYTGIKNPNFNKNYKRNARWAFEIIPLNDKL